MSIYDFYNKYYDNTAFLKVHDSFYAHYPYHKALRHVNTVLDFAEWCAQVQEYTDCPKPYQCKLTRKWRHVAAFLESIRDYQTKRDTANFLLIMLGNRHHFDAALNTKDSFLRVGTYELKTTYDIGGLTYGTHIFKVTGERIFNNSARAFGTARVFGMWHGITLDISQKRAFVWIIEDLTTDKHKKLGEPVHVELPKPPESQAPKCFLCQEPATLNCQPFGPKDIVSQPFGPKEKAIFSIFGHRKAEYPIFPVCDECKTKIKAGEMTNSFKWQNDYYVFSEGIAWKSPF